jgi:hypothetical protein
LVGDRCRKDVAIRSHYPDELLVDELADAEIGKLAAVTRVFDAAKGQFGCGSSSSTVTRRVSIEAIS